MSEREEQESLAEGRPKCGHGGPRPGSGRPRKGTFTPVQGDLIYGKKLLSSLMRDESQPTLLRARCALAIVTRGGSRESTIRVDDAKLPVAAGSDAESGGDNPPELGEVAAYLDSDDQAVSGEASEPQPG